MTIKKHVMSMTYLPKIQAVLSGECKQTIRKLRKKPICKNDIITFHGWSGRPYRSKWDWRKRVVVTEAIQIYIDDMLGIATLYTEKSNLYNWHSWDSVYVTNLARRDYIDQPSRKALRDVLFGLNGAPDSPEEYQIIRW